MAYNTGNPLGSTDPRDLSDNSENFDDAVNGPGLTWTDRLGNTRISLRGGTGYVGTGTNGAIEDYAVGQVLSGYNVIIRYNAEFYRPSASATLPYTTTATPPDADSNLSAVGDATLRQQLSLEPSDGLGAAIVNGATIYVDTIAERDSLTGLVDGAQVIVGETGFIYKYTLSTTSFSPISIAFIMNASSKSDLAGKPAESGYLVWVRDTGRVYEFDASDLSTEVSGDTYQGIYVAPDSDTSGTSGAWVLVNPEKSSPELFEATGDGVADDTDKVVAMFSYSPREVTCKDGAIYLMTDSCLISSRVKFNLNGATFDYQLTTNVPGFSAQADNIEIYGGTVTVSGGLSGGFGGALNPIFSGSQATGNGWSGLHVHHMTVSTDRPDAGAHIGLIGENRNFRIHDITVPDNAVCRNIIGCEWGGTPMDGTGHPHNGKIYNIDIGAISTPTTQYAYGVWLSAAFNIHVENVTMEQGFGLLMATRGDNANTYAPAEYKALVGTGITFENLSINSCYGYGVRVIGSNRSATLDNVPMNVRGKGLRVVGAQLGGNVNFGLGWEQCAGVEISGIDFSGEFTGGITTGVNVDNSVVRGGSVTGSKTYGASVRNDARGSGVERIHFYGNNTDLGAAAGNAAVVLRDNYDCFAVGCTFGEYDGVGETQEYSIYAPADAVRPRLFDCHTYAAGTNSYLVNGVSTNSLAATGLDNTTGAI